MNYRFRPISPTDEPFLWEMLYYAAHVDEEPGGSIETAEHNPFLPKYVTHWGQPGDLGFVVEEAETQQRLGAAWLRVFVGAEKNCDNIADGTPELAIAVIPSCTGQRIGAQLLGQLLSAAALVYPAVYLSVRATNPAKRLYERFGFVVIGELTNHVGGKSFHMKKDFFKDLKNPGLIVVASLFIHPGRELEFHQFETEAARIMKKYRGQITQVIRPTMAGQSGSSPHEIHIVSFPSLESFEAYRGDPDLAQLAPLRQAAIVRTEIIIGEEGDPYL